MPVHHAHYVARYIEIKEEIPKYRTSLQNVTTDAFAEFVNIAC